MKSKRQARRILVAVVFGLFGSLGILSPTALGQNPVPLINQPLSPDAVKPGGAGFTLTVNGTGFVSGAVVNWNGSALATTFVSDSQLTASVPAANIATASTASVTVANPSPGEAVSNAVFFPITTASSSVSFSTTTYSITTDGWGMTTGDFNGDGKLDLAATNLDGSAVSILLGNGDGTFQPHVDYATGTTPSELSTGDFNGDGKTDLVVANTGDGTISILLGNGDGTFQPHKDYAAGAGTGPRCPVDADFNGDGKLDLAVGSNSSTVVILLGNGDGTFQAPVSYTAAYYPNALAVGDFNGDGKLDLATANYSDGSVSVLIGNGDGTLQPAVDYAVGDGLGFIATADFNRDGKLDLVTGNSGPKHNSILLGNGDGTFQAPVGYVQDVSDSSLAVGDLNGDGNLDLGDFYATSAVVLLGKGDGTFKEEQVQVATTAVPLRDAVGDFNGDGRLDVAVASLSSASVSVLLQTTTVSLSTTSLMFATQLIGTTSAAQRVKLTNTGALALTISSIGTSGDFLQTNTCGSSLPPGVSCAIDVSFKPTAKGTRTGSLTIADNAANSPQTVELTGVGTVVALSPSVVNFGSEAVGSTTEPRIITVTNTGSTALNISNIAVSGGDFSDFSEVSACTSSLPAGASCTVKVRFSPKAKGQRQSSLDVMDDGGGSPQTVRLKGTGT